MTEVILIRHGLTAWNRERRFQGSIDIPLEPEGHAEAQQAAVRVGELAASRPVDAIYCSALTRARQTAEPIARALGLPLTVEPGLGERHYGAFEGLTPVELERDWADEYRRWREREPDFGLPGGGESLRSFYDRVNRALESLAARHPGQRVVAVTHGGVLDCAYRLASQIDLAAVRRHDLLNASLNTILREPAGWRVHHWGDVSHLQPAGGTDKRWS
jgi:probable phosphoglycerate mutase